MKYRRNLKFRSTGVCLLYQGFHYSEVCYREVALYLNSYPSFGLKTPHFSYPIIFAMRPKHPKTTFLVQMLVPCFEKVPFFVKTHGCAFVYDKSWSIMDQVNMFIQYLGRRGHSVKMIKRLIYNIGMCRQL